MYFVVMNLDFDCASVMVYVELGFVRGDFNHVHGFSHADFLL